MVSNFWFISMFCKEMWTSWAKPFLLLCPNLSTSLCRRLISVSSLLSYSPIFLALTLLLRAIPSALILHNFHTSFPFQFSSPSAHTYPPPRLGIEKRLPSFSPPLSDPEGTNGPSWSWPPPPLGSLHPIHGPGHHLRPLDHQPRLQLCHSGASLQLPTALFCLSMRPEPGPPMGPPTGPYPALGRYLMAAATPVPLVPCSQMGVEMGLGCQALPRSPPWGAPGSLSSQPQGDTELHCALAPLVSPPGVGNPIWKAKTC